MQLFLEAMDTFFFRDGRPFTRGEQSEGYSIEMPYPSTVMGALRTAYIASNGGLKPFEDGLMREVIGTKESLDGASIRIRGVFIGGLHSLFFPTPRDLVSEKKSDNSRLYLLTLQEAPDFASNAALSALLTWDDPERQVEYKQGFVTSDSLRHYLLGAVDGLSAETKSLLINEPKVGIARSRSTHTVEEGMLYRINMKRFCQAQHGFVVDVDGLDHFPSFGLLKLGGENKSFQYQTVEQDANLLGAEDRAKIVSTIETDGLFKLYLATPAIFDQGWLPRWVQPDFRCDIVTANDQHLRLQLIAAAVGNPITVGGWSVANSGPKPAYRAVPTGTVYYFRLLDDTKPQEVVDHFHYRNLSDRQLQEGFGLSYVGVIAR